MTAAFTTPDWPAQARRLSERTGVPERRVLEIVASTLSCALATATSAQHRFHLSRDLDMVEARIRLVDA